MTNNLILACWNQVVCSSLTLSCIIIHSPFQVAALAVCQYLAACASNPEPELPLPVRQQESSHHSLYLSPPATPRLRTHRMRRSCPEATPTAEVILQLMEMGFPRKKIEFAIRALGEYICHGAKTY